MKSQLRVVFDCNILLPGAHQPRRPFWPLCETGLSGRAFTYSSTYVIEELRVTATSPRICAKFTRITDAAIASLIENIERVATSLNSVLSEFCFIREMNSEPGEPTVAR